MSNYKKPQTIPTVIKFKDLPNLRKKFKNKKIVFCDGCFDLTHAGHALFFENCKKHGDILVVGVGSDQTVRKYKINRPILNEHLRLKMIASLKPVNYCFIQPPISFKNPDELLEVTAMELKQLKPDVYVINSDAFNIPRRKEILERYPKVTMRILKRTAPKKFDSISTTKIIEYIKKS